ncbi:Asp-hemolysin [Phlebopus sp. FC_14]|nr:Asp-hemolysin [Phlebopus sp. FC_14]
MSTETPQVDGDPRAEAQWVKVTIKNWVTSSSIKVQDAQLDWGKFYNGDDKSDELKASEINSIVIAPSQSRTVSASGRANASSGTEGSFSLYEGSTKICKVYWNCPWGKKDNDFEVSTDSARHTVTVGDWNKNSGAIGNVNVDVERF